MEGTIIQWCEIDGEATVTTPDTPLTRDDDAKLIQQLRDIDEQTAEDGQYSFGLLSLLSWKMLSLVVGQFREWRDDLDQQRPDANGEDGHP